MGRNTDSASWAFIVAFVQTVFDALSAESMTAFRVDERLFATIPTDRTAEFFIDYFLEC